MAQRTIHVIVPIALKEVMEELGPDFERDIGYRLGTTHMLNPQVPGYAAAHDDWDIAITNPWHVNEIVAAGHALAESHRALARSPLAFGARGVSEVRPTTSSEGIKAALKAAEKIGFTGIGTSGDKFRGLAHSLGILPELEGKLVPLEGGGPMRALQAGQVDLAALPLTNIAPVAGVSAVAVCPEAMNVHIDISLCLHPAAPDSVHDLVNWLIDPQLDDRLGALGAERFAL
ncbi:MAG: substrate-binding domain-containing protein [Cohaesibacteraceae bacterium]